MIDGEESEKTTEEKKERQRRHCAHRSIESRLALLSLSFTLILSLSLSPLKLPYLAGHGQRAVDVEEGDGLRHCGWAAERGEEGGRASFERQF